jgi:hypothetical protein
MFLIIRRLKMIRKYLIWLGTAAFLWSRISGVAATVVEEVIEVPVVENPVEQPGEEPAEEPGDEVSEDKLSFMNSDRMAGLLVSMDPKSGIAWQSPFSAKPIDFKLESLDRIELKSRGSEGKKWGSASIHLSNDDALWGDIVSLSPDQLVLQTWYSGTVTVRRPMIARIKVQNEDSTVVYEGPKSLAEWKTQGQRGAGGSWEFKKGALYSQSQFPIARKIDKMPEKVKIEFELSWQGSYPAMGVSFFNDNITHQSDCYTLTLSGSSIYLYRYSRNTGSSHLGNAEYGPFGSGAKRGGKFTILADRKEKQVALLIDGEMVRQWKDNTAGDQAGDVLMFYPQNQTAMKVSGIVVSQWDGRIPTAADETKEKSTEDLIRLGNGDKVSGKVLKIENGAIKFQASYADMDIPLTRVVEVVFAENTMERARRNQFDAKFTLCNGGVVTLDLEKVQSDEARGKSENFGALALPLSAARELEFNLYAEKVRENDLSF